MTCPLASVKTSDQPLIAVLLVFVTMMFAVRPVFHVFVVYETRQPPSGGGWVVVVVVVVVEVVVDDGGRKVVEVVVVVVEVDDVSRPTKWIAMAAWPESGRLCPTPWTLIASTGAIAPVLPYRVRVQPDCGVSVKLGVWLTPSTLVHCLISSLKFGKASVVSAVPWNNCMRGRAPVKPGNALRTKLPQSAGVWVTWPLAQALFHIDGSSVRKQKNGTPMNAAPALKTSG